MAVEQGMVSYANRSQWQTFSTASENVTLPSGLQTITSSHNFDQSLENVKLPSGLQTIMSSHNFHQSLRPPPRSGSSACIEPVVKLDHCRFGLTLTSSQSLRPNGRGLQTVMLSQNSTTA